LNEANCPHSAKPLLAVGNRKRPASREFHSRQVAVKISSLGICPKPQIIFENKFIITSEVMEQLA